MPVFTQVNRNDLEDSVGNYDVGELFGFQPSNSGQNNTVYLVRCARGKFAPTLLEASNQWKEASNSVALMSYLAAKEFNCAVPIPDESVKELRILQGKPAFISTFIEGERQRP